jgi:hypothetical protein
MPNVCGYFVKYCVLGYVGAKSYVIGYAHRMVAVQSATTTTARLCCLHMAFSLQLPDSTQISFFPNASIFKAAAEAHTRQI